MCKISIVVPVYNKEKYIENTVNSILKQSFKDFELLLIDDGSTDNSGAICDRYSLLDERISVYHIINAGVSAARNYGIRKAVGKYICFLDSDDYIYESYLEKLLIPLEKNASDIAICDYYTIINNHKYIHGLRPYISNNELYEIIRYDLLCVVWNKLFVKEKINHLFDESISICEDSAFCINYFIDNNTRIEWINEPLYAYINHNDGLTHSYRSNYFDNIENLFILNLRLTRKIKDKNLRYLALHHICLVYLYGTYTYIFENIANGPLGIEEYSYIKKIINNKKYRRIILFLLRNYNMGNKDFTGKSIEKLTIKQIFYIIFSIFNMGSAVYILAKIKKILKK